MVIPEPEVVGLRLDKPLEPGAVWLVPDVGLFIDIEPPADVPPEPQGSPLAPTRPEVPGVVVLSWALGLLVPLPMLLVPMLLGLEALGIVPAGLDVLPGVAIVELELAALVPVVPDVVALLPIEAPPPLAPALPLPAATAATLVPRRATAASTAIVCLVCGMSVLLVVLPTSLRQRGARNRVPVAVRLAARARWGRRQNFSGLLRTVPFANDFAEPSVAAEIFRGRIY